MHTSIGKEPEGRGECHISLSRWVWCWNRQGHNGPYTFKCELTGVLKSWTMVLDPVVDRHSDKPCIVTLLVL